MKDIRNYSLLGHNTFGIDACCRRFVEYASVEEAQQIVASLSEADEPLLLLGGGSNLLLTQDYPGTVLHSAILGVRVVAEEGDKVFLECGSGEVFDDVVAYAVKHGYHGAENLSLIPGEVGASAVQNIGAYGAEAKDIIYKVEAVEVATGKVVWLSNEDCGYGYRQSRFKHEWHNKYLITHVVYELSRTFVPSLEYGNINSALAAKGIEKPTAEELRQVIIEIRRAKLPDPDVQGNAGSFFMNPIVPREKLEALQQEFPRIPFYELNDGRVKIPAGWMIDQCGWKGKALGPAAVHDKQALVLVNRGGAKGSDILALSDAVRASVRAKFGIDIHPEVNLVGK